MFLRLETIPTKHFVGNASRMSLASDTTRQLWHGFMPFRKDIFNVVGTEYFCLQEYEPDYFQEFDPKKEFIKWAAMEVFDLSQIPNGMRSLTLEGGLYAVFLHKGTAAEAATIYMYIFNTWLPTSGYVLDNRPQFQIMGEKYKNDDPNSEEEIWIPVKPKG
jgi:AraC family transcriptional regulator